MFFEIQQCSHSSRLLLLSHLIFFIHNFLPNKTCVCKVLTSSSKIFSNLLMMVGFPNHAFSPFFLPPQIFYCRWWLHLNDCCNTWIASHTASLFPTINMSSILISIIHTSFWFSLYMHGSASFDLKPACIKESQIFFKNCLAA